VSIRVHSWFRVHSWSLLALTFLLACPSRLSAAAATSKQQSLDEWRSLTSSSAPPPRAFVKGDNIRFFFPHDDSVEAFHAHWSRGRVPTDGYRVSSALLHWEQKLPRMPAGDRGWREAEVIAGDEWHRLATNFISELTPASAGHGVYYEAFLADRLLYRDAQGLPRVGGPGDPPKDVTIDHRFSVDETLEILPRLVEKHVAGSHPAESLFLLMAPNPGRYTQPLLLDNKLRHCVLLSPAALHDTTERGVGLTITAQGLSAVLLEGHGLALIKNPVSSAARLGDLVVATLVRFLRLPLPKTGSDVPPVAHRPGMDLAAWEGWLDRYTGTRREDGSMRPLIDGDQFFPRLEQVVSQATNHIRFNVYIFDRDDVAAHIADQLKERSKQVEVKVVLDRMGSVGAGVVPPSTPLPNDFMPPSSIASYLRQDSHVQVRSFLNPWFSADHSKVFLVDGAYAWLGGMNLGREYRYEWHDMMLELTGPVVVSFEDEFRRNWAHASLLGDAAYLAALFHGPLQPQPQPGPWMQLRRLPTKTAWKPFASAVLGSLRHAQSYIYVENPYLFDKRVILTLVKARQRGVDVRVILPRVNDFKAGGRGNIVIANYLMQHGVRVYFYPTMTHVKALLVDDWACVGSGNLNHLSLRVNQEQNIATSDPAFAATLKRDLFKQDFARSYELTAPISVDWVDYLTDVMLEGF
jgi:cardiolipin synthase